VARAVPPAAGVLRSRGRPTMEFPQVGMVPRSPDCENTSPPVVVTIKPRGGSDMRAVPVPLSIDQPIGERFRAHSGIAREPNHVAALQGIALSGPEAQARVAGRRERLIG